MNQRAWLGLALIIVYVGYGYFKVRAERRSGKTQSFGHPTLDAFLLFASGLLLAAALVLLSFHFGSHHQGARLFVYIFLLLLGGGLTWLCSRILRRPRN
jgi:hypothetical protein